MIIRKKKKKRMTLRSKMKRTKREKKMKRTGTMMKMATGSKRATMTMMVIGSSRVTTMVTETGSKRSQKRRKAQRLSQLTWKIKRKLNLKLAKYQY